jgi:hypothetical protein
MGLIVKAYDNGDHVCLVWLPTDLKPIPQCRGFGIQRTLNGGEPAFLQNHVGFADGQEPPGKGDEWKWPIQRYLWWDYSVNPGDKVQYQIVPVVGPNQGSLTLADNLKSELTSELEITGQASRNISAYFNRGIIASQWVTKELAAEEKNQKLNKTSLMSVVQKPGDPLRNGLSGLLRPQILAMLKQVKDEGGKAFLALYELNDPELVDAMTALGKNCNLILGNGAFKSPSNDENADIRAKLKAANKINVFDRLVSSGHFAHNKILICCDKNGKAQQVLSGSTNWTVTGLCTQANNGLIIDDPQVADAYLQEWERLHQAGNAFPPDLVKANSMQKTFTVDNSRVSVWFVPTDAMEDLQQARRLINQAQEGILFLFFNPGPFQEDPSRWTLLQSILYRHQPESNPYYNPNLYIRGVVNQEITGVTVATLPADQRTPAKLASIRNTRHLNPQLDPANPVHPVALISGGVEPPQRLDEDVQVPANIKAKFHDWEQELLGASMVMIHSKCIVIDPFGEHPVVMTGSHNLGPKASEKNDDNLVIIEGNAALAQAYAVNIIAIYQEYRFRHYVAKNAASPNAWHGLEDNDTWQQGHLTGDAEGELQFWLGQKVATGSGSGGPPPPQGPAGRAATAAASPAPAATPAKPATAAVGRGASRHPPAQNKPRAKKEPETHPKLHAQGHHGSKGKNK